MIDRQDFATLFMWGIQFDSHVGWLTLQPRKADKGTYWTAAILAFLDRLGTKIGYTTDVEVAVLSKYAIDMVWYDDKEDKFIFIEHENSWNIDKIEKAITRLRSEHKEKKRCADLKILISYSWPGKEKPTKEKDYAINRLIDEFVREKDCLAIIYPYDKWPNSKDKNSIIDLTLFNIKPENVDAVDEILKNKTYSFFKNPKR